MNETGEAPLRLAAGNTGEMLRLDPAALLGAGGQARVYAVPGRPERVAKLYHAPTTEQAAKLQTMLARPPGAMPPGARVIWPADLVRDRGGRAVGLLMPRVEGLPRAFELYNPATRRRGHPLFHYGLLNQAAGYLAAALGALHAAGYVVGDVNGTNVLVAGDGSVVLIDTDSFQVTDLQTGKIFRCPVGRPEFTPPELQGTSLAESDRAPEHDRFGFGVLVFLMLMEGTHPFAGRWTGKGEPVPLERRIARGLFPYGPQPSSIVHPPRTAPPFELLDPGVRQLMVRCFADGHDDPSARPDAEEWRRALGTAEASLVRCPRNEQHRFGHHLEACPWCARARLLRGRDPFPSWTEVERGEHLRPLRPPRPPERSGPARAATGRPPNFVQQFRNLYLWAALAIAALAAFSSDPPMAASAIAALGLLGVGWAGVVRRPRSHLLFATLTTAAVPVLLLIGALSAPPVAPPLPRAEGGGLPGLVTGLGPLPMGFAYDVTAVEQRPEPVDAGALAAAVTGIRVGEAWDTEPGEPATVLGFVVDETGRVIPATVTIGPRQDSLALAPARSALTDIRFRPAERGGEPVPSRIHLPMSWDQGRAVPLLDQATWNRGQDSIPVGLPGAVPPLEAAANPMPYADDQPELINRHELHQRLSEHYPPALRDMEVEGEATLRFVVDPQGRAESATVTVVSATHPEFAEAAARAVGFARFKPGVVDGRPVRVLIQIPFDFRIAW